MSFKAIIFDLGNVLVFVNHMIMCEGLSRWDGSPKDIYSYIFREGLEAQFDGGEITPVHFFSKVKEKFRMDLDFDNFVRIWSSGFIPNTEIFPIIKELRSLYRLCLLSNTNQIHFEEICRSVTVLSEFEHFFLSYQLGVRKPNRSIFQKVLDFLKEMPQECVYIDDIEEFVEAAQGLGMHGILYRDVSSLKKCLDIMGIYPRK